MSTTLSKGYKLPADGDRGSTFYNDLEANITLVNSHDHDGTDGERIHVKNLTKGAQTLLAAGWSADAGGSTYTQSVTMPTGYLFDEVDIRFKNTANGNILYPTVTKTGASAYTISVNDNTLEILCTYV